LKTYIRPLISLAIVLECALFINISIAFGEDVIASRTSELKVVDGYISSDTIQPVDFTNKKNFPIFYNDSGKIYAVSKITKPTSSTRLKHLWFLRDQIILDATIPVKEDQTKAVSGLILKPNWTGKWRVDITDQDGTLLYTIPFVIQKKPQVQQVSSEVTTSIQEPNAGFGRFSVGNPIPAP